MTDHDCPHAVTLRNLLDACERGRPLTDIADRLRVEVGRLDTAPRPTREQARKAVSRAVFDPGSVVKRETHADGDPDELSVWQSKAVMAVLAEMGLCVTDIGGQQVDDDTVHRTEVDRPDPTRVTRRGLL